MSEDIKIITPDAGKKIAITLKSLPGMGGMFAKGIFLSMFRKQGVLRTEDVPLITVELPKLTIPMDRLAYFKEVCGDDSELPMAFPETWFMGMMGQIVTHPAFPLSPMGLIHVRQIITQHRPIKLDASLSLYCELKELRAAPRGIEVDCGVYVKDENGVCWEGTVMFLSRSERARAPKKSGEKRKSEPKEAQIVIDVPENTGRRYAKASGDYNPHHMTRPTAKLMGFKRPIAHGMWTLAKAVALLPSEAKKLPCKLDVSFKRPILMPAKIGANMSKYEEGKPLSFEIFSVKNGEPHVVGTIERL